MKVLQINKFFYRKGGAEVYFFDLSNLLEEHGHEIIPFSMDSKSTFETGYSDFFVSEIDISRPSLSWKGIKSIGRIMYSFEAKKSLEELIKKTKPDICHIHNIYHHISPSIFAVLKKYNIPVVMTIHDYKLICPNYSLFNKDHVCEKCFVHKYYQPVFQRCIKNSSLAGFINFLEMSFHKAMKFYEKGVDVFISPSEFVKNKMVEWKQDENKFKVIPHFINTTDVDADFTNDGYIAYVGRISPEKGIQILVDAMKQVIPEIKLKVLGNGPIRESLQVQSKDLNVEFLGFKNKDDLKKIISKAKFVVVPSVLYEVFGLSIIEAFAMGKPVIGANIGAIPELVKDNQTGLLFEPGNAKELALKIDSLYNNDSWVVEMGENARGLVEDKLNADLHYQKMVEVYENLIEKRPKDKG